MSKDLTKKIIAGYELTREEALALYSWDLGDLKRSADSIRHHFCGDAFDLCAIINGKSGHCSENCSFCAQSRRSNADVAVHGLVDEKTLLAHAKKVEAAGIPRYSLVAVGRRLSKKEVEKVADMYRVLKDETHLHLCLSGGLLDSEDLELLKDAGLERLHNNLETSRRFFPSICNTHSYDDKIATIRAAQELGIDVCSGGIIGVGETREDRIDLALTLRDLGIKSVPINILHAIEGTTLAHQRPLSEDEIMRTVAIFRHILPKAFLRLAGGRIHLQNEGADTLNGGMNAAITGDFLNTCGAAESSDHQMIKDHGFHIVPAL